MRTISAVAFLAALPWLIVLGTPEPAVVAGSAASSAKAANSASELEHTYRLNVAITRDGAVLFEGVKVAVDEHDGRILQLEEHIVDNRQSAAGEGRADAIPPHVVDLRLAPAAPSSVVSRVLLTIALTGIDDVRISWARQL